MADRDSEASGHSQRTADASGGSGLQPDSSGVPLPLPLRSGCPVCGSEQRDASGRCAVCAAELGPACARCGTPALPAARFCSNCGRPLEESAPGTARPGSEHSATELRQVTVVFCDLVGSTWFASEMDAEDFTDLLGMFHHRVASLMRRHGGFVANYMGDGALTYFGYPQAHEDDVEQAVRAALEVVGAVSGVVLPDGRRLHVRVGISTGVAIVGDVIGTGRLRGLDIAGEAPNLAARLQTIAEPDTVLIDQGTYRVIGGIFECQELGAHNIKGWSKPIPVWKALRPKPILSRFKARTGRGSAPLVGREAQLNRLLSLWQTARGGNGRVVLLVGEPGIGKSRLVLELIRRTAAEHIVRISHFCDPHYKDVPLYPVIEQIERGAGFAPTDSVEAKLAKLAALLQGTPEEERELIAELLMLPTNKRPAALQLAPHKRRERMLRAIMADVARLSALRPVLMILEDAQWGDSTTLELLRLGLERIATVPVLLIVTARPEFRPDWPETPHVQRLSLASLAPEEAANLVRCISGPEALSPARIANIVSRSDGVPLFLEEVTKVALEAEQETQARLDRKLAGAPVPVTIHASLIARLDRLDEARGIAEVAAVIGREFDFDMLARVTEAEEDLLGAALDRLVASGLVLQDDPPASGRYRFKHALIQDAAYGMIVRQRRRALHQRIARVLEAKSSSPAAVQPQLLAHHWTEAAVPENAVEWWLRAGLHSLSRSLTSEALAQLERGLALTADLPSTDWRLTVELDLLLALGKAQIATLGHAAPEVGTTFDRARALCEQTGLLRRLPTVLFGQWTYALLSAKLDRALRLSDDILTTGRGKHDSVSQLLGCYTKGIAHFYAGDLDLAGAFLRHGIALYDPSRREAYAQAVVSDPSIMMRCFLSWTFLCAGEIEQADRIGATTLEEARKLGHTYTLATAVYQRAFRTLSLDSPAAALPCLEELWSLAHEHGFPVFEAIATILGGWCNGMAGDAEAGLARMRAGYRAYCDGGSRLSASSFLRMEAEVLERAGHVEQGLEALRNGMDIAKRSGAQWDEAEFERVRGSLLRAQGDLDAAERALTRACLVAEHQGAKLFELRAGSALAELRAYRGHRSEARDLLARLCASFGDSPDFADLAGARALMGKL